MAEKETKSIPLWLYEKLDLLGLIPNVVRGHNVGSSDYSQHLIQPWAVWKEYSLNPWDADIVKRVLRTKDGDSRKMDYEKIIHICEERIRQIDCEEHLKPTVVVTAKPPVEYYFRGDTDSLSHVMPREGDMYNVNGVIYAYINGKWREESENEYFNPITGEHKRVGGFNMDD